MPNKLSIDPRGLPSINVPGASGNSAWKTLTDNVRAVLGQWSLAGAVIRERRALAELDDRMLKDIGVSRADVYREINRSPFDTKRRRG